MSATPTAAEDDAAARGILSALIDESGLSIAEFARVVLGRDERTVRRWLAGHPIPESHGAWLDRVEDVETRRGRIVVSLTR